MKLQNKSYIFLLLFFFSSCVAKKTTVEFKEIIVRDTINTETVRTVIKPIKETLYVDNPCDSLGILKEFEKTIVTPKAIIKLYNDKGAIKVDVNVDSIIDLRISEFKSNYKNKIETKEVEIIRYRFPMWLILTATFSILFNIILLKSKFF
jgi:hypothetical protein